MARRAPGEGSIRKRSNGLYEIAIPVGHTESGHTKRVSIYARTKTELLAKVEEFRVQRATRGMVVPSTVTVAGYLQLWLTSKETECAATTVANYRWHLEHYVIPGIGDLRLQRLTPLAVDALLQQLLEGRAQWVMPPAPAPGKPAPKLGRRNPEGKVSLRCVRYLRTVLHAALGKAVELEVLKRNPVLMPKGTRSRKGQAKPTVWTAVEARAFLEAAQSSRFALLYELALVTGARRGELLGLRGGDVDELAGVVRIEREVVSLGGAATVKAPKSDNARRVLHLSERLVERLAGRRDAAQRQREVMIEAEVWRGLEDPYLWGRNTGGPVNPRTLLSDFAAIVARAGVPRIRFHDLRHTHASLAMGAREALPTLSARLGHHSQAFTLDVYSHLVPGHAETAANAVEALVTSSPRPRRRVN